MSRDHLLGDGLAAVDDGPLPTAEASVVLVTAEVSYYGMQARLHDASAALVRPRGEYRNAPRPDHASAALVTPRTVITATHLGQTTPARRW
jgi:hypothetical protein